MHLHILGICGTFMGGLALLAREGGHRVTGCDARAYPPMSTQLADHGIELAEGYEAAQVRLRPDLFVVGNVVTRGNPLMEEVLNRGLPYTSGPQWLAEHVLRGKWTLAVAGTHGKTTTSAMLAWILERAGLRPGFLIGGVPLDFAASARTANSPFFVVEADEYDTAFFDKRSKFLHYRPRTAVLNNLEFDHGDIFADLAAIETQVHHLVRTIPAAGRIVARGDDPALARVLERGCWTPVERFGVASGWHAADVGADGSFTVRCGEASFGRLAWSLAGAHNRSNALAAIAAARHAGVSPGASIEALASFRGVRRRLEVCGSAAGVTVYDDFAHHPTAMRATVEALRSRVGAARILAVVELRSNTMKLGLLKDDLPASLAGADLVFCYAAGLGWDAGRVLGPLGDRASVETDLDRLAARVAGAARPGDQVLVMSNGDFGGLHRTLLERLGRAGG